jgi:hypothetical protein
MHNILHGIRFAIRQLRKSPGFPQAGFTESGIQSAHLFRRNRRARRCICGGKPFACLARGSCRSNEDTPRTVKIISSKSK